MITDYEDVYELDSDGETGPHMGWVLYGDVDPFELDLFLGEWEVEEQSPDGGDWDAVECYVRKVPIRATGGWRYVYANNPGPGARKCLLIERNWFWGHWCMNHIYEPASSGFPVDQVKNPIWPMVNVRISPPEHRRPHARGPLDGEAMVYLCRPCATKFTERRDEAVRERLAEYRQRHFLPLPLGAS